MFRYMYACVSACTWLPVLSQWSFEDTYHQRVFYAYINIGSNWYCIAGIPEMRCKWEDIFFGRAWMCVSVAPLHGWHSCPWSDHRPTDWPYDLANPTHTTTCHNCKQIMGMASLNNCHPLTPSYPPTHIRLATHPYYSDSGHLTIHHKHTHTHTHTSFSCSLLKSPSSRQTVSGYQVSSPPLSLSIPLPPPLPPSLSPFLPLSLSPPLSLPPSLSILFCC
jgi:hypothetical protein